MKNSVPQLISWLQQKLSALRGDFSDDLSGHRDGMATPGIDLLELCLKKNVLNYKNPAVIVTNLGYQI